MSSSSNKGLNGTKRTHSSFKWVKEIRGLASDPSHNDYLKIDYIEVNLNNSRKLITNVNQLTQNSEKQVTKNFEINESLIKLQPAKQNLSWLDNI